MTEEDIQMLMKLKNKLKAENKQLKNKLDEIGRYVAETWKKQIDSGEILIELENILYDNVRKINKDE